MALEQHMLSELRRLVGADQVLTAKEDLIPYSFDGTAALQQLPECVVFARSTEQVVGVLKLAGQARTPVVTRGSGTGLSGGSLPSPGSLVLGLAKMDKVLELDRANLTLLAEAGATTQAIADAASAAGLFYPPDPGSLKISTIGGNVAENSGGLRGLKYGVTRNYVMGLEVVLPEGEVLWTGNKCVKDAAGYSLRDLFIGSEGTLGVITKVLLKLIPKPAAQKTLLATFPQMDQAAQTVSDIIAAQIIPCTLEFLDRTTIQCVEDFARVGLPLDCEALLLMETDGHPGAVAEEAAQMERIARQNGATEVRVAKDDAEAARLATARRSALSALARVSPTTILEDATVPRSELARMIRFVAAVAAKYQLRIGTFGHMGDGNLHPTFLTDERNAEEMHRVEQAFQEIFTEAIRLGGTITGEHGIGVSKKSFLPRFAGDAQMRVMRELRRALDPRGILNPGKMFDA
ncbi:MAG TPA: FAD-linked oxidase C-terminal domain-containing protein [Verrucomicrobiota bacterium]|jgi:glycolate oxidase|nr:FAD-binding protein [Verrucomicrobiota bacterium]OQC27161.1 MAG: putative FAD-linked oxidoreductase [Verrucomicrobia bacterium ADurb.Bin063]HRR64760.1 FAD-linked oxidase C-terminal domain-containing protein [Candidatus Paceibacterota bacterium]MBP8013987.1 FAD-binding protein [Verrucomicrobiota bacterium]MDI9374011.1 FAD-linked oxidase C-terminal domain-containing protein [Verrucomicrobiota bacterium]